MMHRGAEEKGVRQGVREGGGDVKREARKNEGSG